MEGELVVNEDIKEEVDEDEDEEEEGGGLSLSAETIAALKMFALDAGIPVLGEDTDSGHDDIGILAAVRDHFDVKDRDETFPVSYTTEDGSRSISFEVKGVKRRLGQTLNSTGLTIWRAAEHLCDFIFRHPHMFKDKTVCELGCGLGMVSILLDKLSVCRCVIATDGDDDTMVLLRENIELTDCTVTADKLYWGQNVDLFLERYPNKFDVVIAADVIYEEEQVEPLIETVVQILKEGATSEFFLAFARRNVPIDAVLRSAENHGLSWAIVDAGESGLEPIYRIIWRV